MQLLKQKGFCTYLALLVAVGFAPTVYAADQGAVKMVTYFPVPYAKYDNLYPTKKLDIGTVNDEDFQLNVGKNDGECTDAPLPFQAKNVILRNIAGAESSESPTLNIIQNFKTNEATFGNEDDTSVADTITFGNLYLKPTTAGPVKIADVQTGQLKTALPSDIFIGERSLPGCPSGRVKWVPLTFSGSEKQYLVCCESGEKDGLCGVPCYGMEKMRETCTGEALPAAGTFPIEDPHASLNSSANIEASFISDYQRSGTWHDDTCSCDCPSGSHGGTAESGLYNNAAGTDNDYSFCMSNCWSDDREDHISDCEKATWTNPTDNDDVRNVGATWNYDECKCDCGDECLYTKKEDSDSWDHICQADYEDGTVAACTSNPAWTWDDASCTCDCGDANFYKHIDDDNPKKCGPRCVKDLSPYDEDADKCSKSGGTWIDESADGSTSCSCDCGDMDFVDGACKKK